MPKAGISLDISKAILDIYESNKQTLELLEVEGVDSDFEQGYNNALEYVMKLLDIEYEGEE